MKYKWRDKTQWRLKFAWRPRYIKDERVTVWLEPYYRRLTPNFVVTPSWEYQTQEKRATELLAGQGCQGYAPPPNPSPGQLYRAPFGEAFLYEGGYWRHIKGVSP